MINVKRLTLISLCMASPCIGSMTLQAQETAAGTQQQNSAQPLPAQWDLQTCIDYALQQNITIRKNRLNAESAEVDVKTAKAALFPSLSFSTGHNVTNRPYQENSSTVSGTEIISSNNKTTYSGNYGLNAQWTVWNGNKRMNTIKQRKMNREIAGLTVAETENSLQEQIAQVFIQILYADESVKINENTLQVSRATY